MSERKAELLEEVSKTLEVVAFSQTDKTLRELTLVQCERLAIYAEDERDLAVKTNHAISELKHALLELCTLAEITEGMNSLNNITIILNKKNTEIQVLAEVENC